MKRCPYCLQKITSSQVKFLKQQNLSYKSPYLIHYVVNCPITSFLFNVNENAFIGVCINIHFASIDNKEIFIVKRKYSKYKDDYKDDKYPSYNRKVLITNGISRNFIDNLLLL